MDKRKLEEQAELPWNPAAKSPLFTWLTATPHSALDQQRLKVLGNVVIPRCAELAMNLIGQALRAD